MEETAKKRVTYTTRLDGSLVEWLKHQSVTEKKRTNILLEEAVLMLKKSRSESAEKTLLE